MNYLMTGISKLTDVLSPLLFRFVFYNSIYLFSLPFFDVSLSTSKKKNKKTNFSLSLSLLIVIFGWHSEHTKLSLKMMKCRHYNIDNFLLDSMECVVFLFFMPFCKFQYIYRIISFFFAIWTVVVLLLCYANSVLCVSFDRIPLKNNGSVFSLLSNLARFLWETSTFYVL